MDNSAEMVKMMSEKVATNKTERLKPLFFDLEHSDYADKKFDIVYTQMVMHHIADLDTLFKRFSQHIKPNGYLAIADLYTEDGSFHGEGFAGHLGFDVEKLAETIEKYDFYNLSYRTCFVINRKISDNEVKQYPVFLLIAQR